MMKISTFIFRCVAWQYFYILFAQSRYCLCKFHMWCLNGGVYNEENLIGLYNKEISQVLSTPLNKKIYFLPIKERQQQTKLYLLMRSVVLFVTKKRFLTTHERLCWILHIFQENKYIKLFPPRTLRRLQNISFPV